MLSKFCENGIKPTLLRHKKYSVKIKIKKVFCKTNLQTKAQINQLFIHWVQSDILFCLFTLENQVLIRYISMDWSGYIQYTSKQHSAKIELILSKTAWLSLKGNTSMDQKTIKNPLRGVYWCIGWLLADQEPNSNEFFVIFIAESDTTKKQMFLCIQYNVLSTCLLNIINRQSARYPHEKRNELKIFSLCLCVCVILTKRIQVNSKWSKLYHKCGWTWETVRNNGKRIVVVDEWRASVYAKSKKEKSDLRSL